MEIRYLVWAGAAAIAVLSLALAAIGFRRRMERGRPAKFRIGLGISLVDVIEGVTGREMSPRAQMKAVAVAAGFAVFALILGVTLLLIQNGVRP